MPGYLTPGKVIRVCPAGGSYEVLADSGTRFKRAVALSDTASSLYGARSSSSYPPGTPVLLYVPSEATTGTSIGFIIGAVRNVPIVRQDSPYSFTGMLSLASSGLIYRVDNDPRFVVSGSEMESDFSYGRAADVLPGEWAKTTYLGGGFFLNDFMLSAGISERSRLDMFLFKDIVRLTAGCLQQWIAAGESTSFLEGSFPSSVERSGATLQESLGALGGNPALKPRTPTKDNPSLFEPYTDKPYYNHQKIVGDLAQGSLETYSIPGSTVNDTPTGLLSVKKGYEGIFEVKAARGISFEKTNIIPVPLALRAPDDLQDELKDVSPEPFKTEDTDLSFFGAEAVRLEGDHNLEKDLFTKFRARDKVWSIPTDKAAVLANLKKAGVEFKDNPELGQLPIEEPYYPEPPAQGIVKPLVDEDGKRTEETKIYDMSSVIRQFPDGSVVIAGGYGEQILMHRGNIYLSCPGDIYSMPGRDSVTIAGGNLIGKALKGTLELEGKTLSAVSAGNLQIMSGGSGVGTMVIESKADGNPSMDAYGPAMEENVSSGGGIVIKSASTALASDTVHVAGLSYTQSKLVLRMYGIEADASAIDFYLRGGGHFRAISSGSMLSVRGQAVEIVAGSFGINSSAVRMSSGAVQVNVPTISGDPRTVTMGGGGGMTSVGIAGQLYSQSLRAISVSSQPGGELGKDVRIGSDIAELSTDKPAGSGQDQYYPGDPIETDTNSKEQALEKWGIVFPEKRYAKISLPIFRWQTMMADTPSTWEQVLYPVSLSKDSEEVAAYPGKDNFEHKGSLKKLVGDGTVEDRTLSEFVLNSN